MGQKIFTTTEVKKALKNSKEQKTSILYALQIMWQEPTKEEIYLEDKKENDKFDEYQDRMLERMFL